MKDKDSLLIGSKYKSTNSGENNNNLNKLIDEISQAGFTYIMLTGDFNFNQNRKAVNTATEAEGKQFYFIEKIRDNFLMDTSQNQPDTGAMVTHQL